MDHVNIRSWLKVDLKRYRTALEEQFDPRYNFTVRIDIEIDYEKSSADFVFTKRSGRAQRMYVLQTGYTTKKTSKKFRKLEIRFRKVMKRYNVTRKNYGKWIS